MQHISYKFISREEMRSLLKKFTSFVKTLTKPQIIKIFHHQKYIKLEEITP